MPVVWAEIAGAFFADGEAMNILPTMALERVATSGDPWVGYAQAARKLDPA